MSGSLRESSGPDLVSDLGWGGGGGGGKGDAKHWNELVDLGIGKMLWRLSVEVREGRGRRPKKKQ